VEHRYWHQGWGSLLDAGARNDPELRHAWAREQIRHDVEQASFLSRDLARYDALTGGNPVPPVGRELPGWRSRTLHEMAQPLRDHGFEVLDATLAAPASKDETLLGERRIGTLRLTRHGHEATVVVRVDDVGEVYARLPDLDL